MWSFPLVKRLRQSEAAKQINLISISSTIISSNFSKDLMDDDVLVRCFLYTDQICFKIVEARNLGPHVLADLLAGTTFSSKKGWHDMALVTNQLGCL